MAISSIQDRFDQPGYATYKNLESLLLKVANQPNYSAKLQEVISFMEMMSMRLIFLQILSAKFAHSCEIFLLVSVSSISKYAMLHA